MALVVTPGAADANSFASVAEYKAYWGSRPNSAVPLAATDPTIETLLIHACRVLSAAFVWTGSASGSVQALPWPRSGMLTRNGYAIASTLIPLALKDAQCELAGQMASADKTADSDVVKQGITSIKAGSVALTFKNGEVHSDADLQMRDIDTIARMIPDAVRLLLVPSWYVRPKVTKTFAFANL